MKNSDIALVILIAFISFGISYAVMNLVMGNPSTRVETIRYVQDISEDILEPDHETFNAYADNLNEEVVSGHCPYGTYWNGLACVSSEESQNTEETPAENQDNENTEEGTDTESEE